MSNYETFTIKLNLKSIESLSMVQLANLAHTLEKLVEEKAPVLSIQELSSFTNPSSLPSLSSIFSIKSYIERQFTEIKTND